MGMVDVYTQVREEEAREKRAFKRSQKGSSLFLRALWAFVWRSYLYDATADRFGSVYRVTGWRSAYVDRPSREHLFILPKWAFWDPKL